MPQDNSLRSAVYKSFITCDDPNGVVECGTMRRSKSVSEKIVNKIKNRPKLCAARKAEREETHGQLLEVSRGAHKLNQVTDSWSERDSKDLLKGALDLQDSLHMLGKLQEASHYMARLKKKKKYEQAIRRTNSSPLGERNYSTRINNPRLSADGSSRDCIEELREVIRDSLVSQNLLPNISAEEKRCFSTRYYQEFRTTQLLISHPQARVNLHLPKLKTLLPWLHLSHQHLQRTTLGDLV